MALQFAKISFDQITTLHRYDIPEHIEALDARLDARLSEEEKADLEYQFRVVYTLESASKSRAHIQFVKPGSEEGKQIHYILEKYKVADEIYPFKSTDVCQEVTRKSGKRFTSHNHVQAIYLYKVRPAKKSKQPENTNKDFCIYHPAYNSYTYSDAWIDRLVSAVNDDNEFKKIKDYRNAN
jgi:hypothetical protein